MTVKTNQLSKRKRRFSPMNIDRIVLAFAGAVILITVVFAVSHSIHWLWVTAFIGANLFQAAFTGFCPLAHILEAAGIKSGKAF